MVILQLGLVVQTSGSDASCRGGESRPLSGWSTVVEDAIETIRLFFLVERREEGLFRALRPALPGSLPKVACSHLCDSCFIHVAIVVPRWCRAF